MSEDDEQSARSIALVVRVLSVSEALTSWLLLGLSVWFYMQGDGVSTPGILALTGAVIPVAGWLVIIILRQRLKALRRGAIEGQLPASSSFNLQENIGMLVMGGGLILMSGFLLAMLLIGGMLFALYGLWALAGLSAFVYTLLMTRNAFIGEESV